MRLSLKEALAAVTLVTAAWLPELCADDANIIDGLRMGADQVTVHALLQDECTSVTAANYEQASFPLAAAAEAHLVCDGYSGGPVGFAKAAFVIADGALVLVEASGVDLESAHDALGEPDGVYLDMNNYGDGTVWLDTENKQLFWLDESARQLL